MLQIIKSKILILVILVVSIVIRIYLFKDITASVNRPGSDYLGFYTSAIDIASGKQSALDLGCSHMPGVYLFYAGIFKIFSVSYLTVLLFNNIFHFCTALAGYFICKNIHALNRIKYFLFVYICLNISKLNFLKFVSTESIYTPLLITGVLSIVLYINSQKLFFGFSSALLLAMSVLFRPVSFLIIIFLSLFFIFYWVYSKNKHYLYHAFLSIILFVLLITPNIIKNYLISETLIPFTSSSGAVFVAGNNPLAGGTWGTSNYYTYINKEIAKAGADLSTPVKWNRFHWKIGITFIKEQPLKFLWLFIKKGILFWSESFVLDVPLYIKFLNTIKILSIFTGIFLLYKIRDISTYCILITLLSYYFTYVIFHIRTRYKIPVDTFVFICMFYTILYIYDHTLSLIKNKFCL